jgi:hypothetical protein
MLPCVGREHYRLSVTDGCRWLGDDKTSMRFRIPELLVNIAHFRKIDELGRCLLIQRFCGYRTAVVGNGRLCQRAGRFCELNDFRASGRLKRKRPAGADRFCQLRIGVARLVVRLLGIFVTLCGRLTLLARFLTAALLLTRRLIWLTGLVLVRHGVSFHGNARTTARSSGSFLTKKKCGSQCPNYASLTNSDFLFVVGDCAA